MTYAQTIAKLQAASADGKYAPDCRRRAVAAYQRMMTARTPRGTLASLSSYANMYGLIGGRAKRKADAEAGRADVVQAMRDAKDAADRFIAEWLA